MTQHLTTTLYGYSFNLSPIRTHYYMCVIVFKSCSSSCFPALSSFLRCSFSKLIIHREKVLALHSWDQTDLPLHFALTLFSTFNPMCTPYINSTCNLQQDKDRSSKTIIIFISSCWRGSTKSVCGSDFVLLH